MISVVIFSTTNKTIYIWLLKLTLKYRLYSILKYFCRLKFLFQYYYNFLHKTKYFFFIEILIRLKKIFLNLNL